MEWLAFLSVVGLALGFLARRRRLGAGPVSLILLLLLVTLVSAGLYQSSTSRLVQANQEFFRTIPRQGRDDNYVSSTKCQSCHPGQYDSWHRSFHRTMTQYAQAGTVVGNFNKVTLELSGKPFRLEQRGDEFWVEMEDPEWQKPTQPARPRFVVDPPAPRVWKRIGLLTGSHHMQVYWVPGRAGNAQFIFPFAWLIEDQRWVPFLQTFLRDPAIQAAPQTWNLNCINCHATGGQPRFDLRVGFLDTRAGEIGIACEACHGPAEEHVRANQNPVRRYLNHAHAATQPDHTIVNPIRPAAKVSAQICGQCHGIRWVMDREEWNRLGYLYRPGRDLRPSAPLVRPTRLPEQPWLQDPLQKNPTFLQDHYWSDGMVRVSGREYSGLIESACHEKGELSCVSCHSMHRSQPDDQLATQMDGNQACVKCHDAARHDTPAHTHHLAGSSGSHCYNCHMPHTTYGLLKAIRSHKITSPTVSESLNTGRPNACNLCHLDRTLQWTSAHLTKWYGQPSPKLEPELQTVSAALLWLMKGDAGQRALIAWHMGWPPARQASGDQWFAPFLAQTLDDPYSTVRYIAHRSLKRLPGYEDVAFDFTGAPTEATRAQDRVMEIWNRSSARTSKEAGSAILIDPARGLLQEQIQNLRAQRNNRSMDLQE